MKQNDVKKPVAFFDLQLFKENVLIEDDSIIKDMVSLIQNQLLEDVPRLRSALQQEDLKTIKSIAHKHKGSTTTAGMLPLSDLFVSLDSMYSLELSRLQSLIDQVEDTFQQVRAEIATQFPDLKN